MDVARLRALWEYAVPGNTVSKSELVTVCSMYLGGASKDDAAMHSAVESVLAIATTSKQVLDLLISGENAVTTLLKASTANAPGKTASSSLRTILDQDLAEDEDDSSVDEGVSEGFVTLWPTDAFESGGPRESTETSGAVAHEGVSQTEGRETRMVR